MNRYFFIGILLIFVGCDPGAHYEIVIENNSSYNIWLIKNEADYTLLLKDSEHVQSMDMGIGSLYQYESCPLYPEVDDTINTRIDGIDTLNLSKPITGNSN